MNREFRYPTGQYLLSVPAGLIDPEDCTGDNDNTAPLIKTAMRELHEETGLKVTEKDTVSVINPCLFSTPGMTDESNALVKIVLNRDSLNGMSQEGAVGGELFDGFDLLTKAQAKKILEDGVDEHGIYVFRSRLVEVDTECSVVNPACGRMLATQWHLKYGGIT